MATRTPLYHEMKLRLDELYARTDREKITHWLVNWERGIKIDYGDGVTVNYSGLKYSGSPVDVFWTILTPTLKREIGETMKTAYATAKDYPPWAAARALDEVAELLVEWVSRIYSRMSEIDRLLRGGGSPNDVPARNPGRLIDRLKPEIEKRRESYRALLPTSRWAKLAWWAERNKWIAGLAATLIGAAIVGIGGVLFRLIGKSS